MVLKGHHVAAEMSQCQNAELLNNVQMLESLITQAILKAGLGLMGIYSHGFSPHGITCIAIISESHLAVHTYPEYHHLSIDIFTCSPKPHAVEGIFKVIQDQVNPVNVSMVHLIRSEMIEVISENTAMTIDLENKSSLNLAT